MLGVFKNKGDKIMRRIIKNFLVLGLALMIIFGTQVSTFAQEQNINISSKELKELRTNLQELGIDDKTQDSLIKKLYNGEVWDSMNPNEIAKVPTDLLTPSINEPIKIYKFPDGSVIKREIKIPEDTNLIFRSPGSGYTTYRNVLISENNGTVGASFRADMGFAQEGYDEILEVYDYQITVVAGSYSDVELNIYRRKETSTSPAYAYLRFHFTSNQGGIQLLDKTCYLKLYVQNDSYWSECTNY